MTDQQTFPETEHFHIDLTWDGTPRIFPKDNTKDSTAALPVECYTSGHDLEELHQRMIKGEAWYVNNRRGVDAQYAARAARRAEKVS